eukprot:5420617-Amphidinium_carterae.2
MARHEYVYKFAAVGESSTAAGLWCASIVIRSSPLLGSFFGSPMCGFGQRESRFGNQRHPCPQNRSQRACPQGSPRNDSGICMAWQVAGPQL